MKSFSLFGDDSQKSEEVSATPLSSSVASHSIKSEEEEHSSSVSSSRTKSKTAYRTISEVADEVGVAPHVLRFWETKFKEVAPLTRAGGRRYYSVEDIEIIKKVQSLLYDEGHTIKGVQAYFKKVKKGEVSLNDSKLSSPALGRAFAEDVLAELQDMREILA